MFLFYGPHQRPVYSASGHSLHMPLYSMKYNLTVSRFCYFCMPRCAVMINSLRSETICLSGYFIYA